VKKVPYLDIFKEGLLVTWKNKFLWFFGVIIVFASIVPNINNIFSQQNGKYFLFVAFFQKKQQLVSMLGLFFAIASLVFFFLKTLATISITKSLNNLELYRQLSISAITKDAMLYLLRVLLVDIISGFALLVLFFVIFLPVAYLFSIDAQMFAIAMGVLAIAIFLALIFVVFYLHKYATFYVVLVNKKIKAAFELASNLFLANVKEELSMIPCYFAGMMLFVFVAVLAVSFFGLIILFFITLGGFDLSGTASFLVGCYVALFASVVVFILSIYVIFLQSIWLLFFKHIATERIKGNVILKKNKIDAIMTEQEIA